MTPCLILLAGATLLPAQTPTVEEFLPPLVRVSEAVSTAAGQAHPLAESPVLLVSAEDAAEAAPAPPPPPPSDWSPEDNVHQAPAPLPDYAPTAAVQSQSPIYEMSSPAEVASAGCHPCQPACGPCGRSVARRRCGLFVGSCLWSGCHRSTDRCNHCADCGCGDADSGDNHFGICGCESTCDWFPHFAYHPEHHGYYYFRPYNWQHVLAHQELIVGMGGDPKAPYATNMFDALYVDANVGPYEEPSTEWNQALPRTTPRLPDLQEMLRQSK